MKVTALSLKVGNVIEHDGKLLQVLKSEAVKPGKGGAYSQMELRDIRTGNKMKERFRTQEMVERAHMDQRDYQFLYADGDTYSFMNLDDYTQVELKADIIGQDIIPYLQESLTVTLESFESEVLAVKLPDTIALEVVEADAVVKGQTASSSYKPALLENGLKVQVPPHIEAGTRIVIKTEDASYVERAKD